MPIRNLEVPRIQVRNVIDTIPEPVTTKSPPPVVSSIQPPVVDVPTPIIDYPVIDVPLQQEWEQQMIPPPQIPNGDQPQQEGDPPIDEVPVTPVTPPTERPTITIGGVEAPLPEPAPLITAGATALVTTAVTLTATILIGKFKDVVLEPMMKRIEAKSQNKKKKIKIKKQAKPVIQYVLGGDDKVYVFKYTQDGTELLDTITDAEKYLREQVDNDSLYEFDNKIILDKELTNKFTKEGVKRFKSLFTPAKSILKKLTSKIAF